MINDIPARLVIDAKDQIGEGPTWDAQGERFIWSDNPAGIVHEARPDGSGSWRESRRWTLGRHLANAVPRARGGLLVGGGTELFLLEEDGTIRPWIQLDADANQVRLNEIKCDPRGRLWAGTLAHDLRPGGGALYCIDPDRRVTTLIEHVTVSNGLDWSPDGSTFYYIDSPTLSVDAFDFDLASGGISHRRTLVRFRHGDCAPDGMTVDREGCLWVACVGTGDVRRFAPDGTLLARAKTSAPIVTSCHFGGSDGRDLFITSAAIRLPDPVLPIIGFTSQMAESAATAPGAGGLFVCRPGMTGRPATPFVG